MRSNGPLANEKVAMGGRGWPGGLVASWPGHSFTASLDDEASRAMREGLDPETLTLFDLLKKPDLSTSDINRLEEGGRIAANDP